MRITKEFTIGGRRTRVSREVFVSRLSGVVPERIQKHYLEVGGRRFPLKQAVSVGVGISRVAFQTQEAYRVARALGFDPHEL